MPIGILLWVLSSYPLIVALSFVNYMVSVQNKKLRLLLLCKENVISTKFIHLLDSSHISLILCITSSATSRDDDSTERIR